MLNYRFTLRKALGADTTEHNPTSGPNVSHRAECSSRQRTNTFALSNRQQQQQTMALANVKVDTYTYEEVGRQSCGVIYSLVPVSRRPGGTYRDQQTAPPRRGERTLGCGYN